MKKVLIRKSLLSNSWYLSPESNVVIVYDTPKSKLKVPVFSKVFLGIKKLVKALFEKPDAAGLAQTGWHQRDTVWRMFL